MAVLLILFLLSSVFKIVNKSIVILSISIQILSEEPFDYSILYFKICYSIFSTSNDPVFKLMDMNFEFARILKILLLVEETK